jgi:hypothetical protein
VAQPAAVTFPNGLCGESRLKGEWAALSIRRAQQKTLPVLGFLDISRPAPSNAGTPLAAFHHGLKENGYVEGRNLTIEYPYAEAKPEQLAMLAAELVTHKVDVIVTAGGARCRARLRIKAESARIGLAAMASAPRSAPAICSRC